MLFRDVIGHAELKKRLVNEVREDRIAHAQLFLGKLGFGGLPLTLAFVQFVMCQNKKENDSCGACASCKKVSQMQHPDVHFSFPTVQPLSKTSDGQFSEWRKMLLNNPYADLHQWVQVSDPSGRKPIISKYQSEAIVKKLSLKSYEGGYKVSIIWMADEMNVVCANKLLKIIEEPPKDTLFILIADSPENVMPTILSRTQLVKIKQVENNSIVKGLENKTNVESDALKSIVSRAEGDVAKVYELIAQEGGNNQYREDFIELMRACYKKQVFEMFEWAEKMAKNGREEQKTFLQYALYMIRQSLMKNYTDEQLLRTSPEEKAFLQKFARFITGNNVMDFHQLLNDAHYSVERNAHAKLLFTNVTFEVMRYIHRA